MEISFTFSWFQIWKHKIRSSYKTSDNTLSIDNSKDFGRKSITPLISLKYLNNWNPLEDEGTICEHLYIYIYLDLNLRRLNLQHSISLKRICWEKHNYCASFKGVFRDGFFLVIKSISKMSCKIEELKFQEGIKTLSLL